MCSDTASVILGQEEIGAMQQTAGGTASLPLHKPRLSSLVGIIMNYQLHIQVPSHQTLSDLNPLNAFQLVITAL